jgi:hypothetical protein
MLRSEGSSLIANVMVNSNIVGGCLGGGPTNSAGRKSSHAAVAAQSCQPCIDNLGLKAFLQRLQCGSEFSLCWLQNESRASADAFAFGFVF